MPSIDPVAHPTDEDAWCAARGAEVALCLARRAVAHGRVGEHPAWHVMPYASVWAVESAHRPEWVGWWVISGDLPSDLVAAQGLPSPREALRAFGKRWALDADALDRGEVPAAWGHIRLAELPALATLLRRRGGALRLWADDEASWPAAQA